MKDKKNSIFITIAFLLDAVGRYVWYHTDISSIFWTAHELAMAIVFFVLSANCKGWAKWLSLYCGFIWLSSILDELSRPLGWDYWRYVYAAILLLLFFSSYKLWNYAQRHSTTAE